MKFFSIFVLTLFLLFSQTVWAQNQVKLVIKDSLTKEVLIGASVEETGTNNGSASDVNGIVNLTVKNTGKINFTIHYVGYTEKTIAIHIPQQENSFEVLLKLEESIYEEVTVTSVRTNSRIEDNPTRIEVLGMEEMGEENGIKPGNIMSLLGDIAGIQMQQVSASSGNTLARVQGLNGRYTQILKDGMPLFGGMSGNFGIMQIPPLDLKQIEIIKGSASTLYGGDAIGGIINLVSKDPGKTPELNLTYNVSSLNETNLNLYAARKFNKVGFTFFGGSTIQKAMDIDKDGLSDVAAVNNFVIHPKLVYYASNKSTLTFNATHTFDLRAGGDMRYFIITNDTLYHVQNKINRSNADVKWAYVFDKNKNINLKISGSNLSQNTGTKFYKFDATQQILYSELSFLNHHVRTDWVCGINLNADVFTNNSTNQTALKNYAYHTLGAYVQNTWRPTEKFIIESGLRSDYHNTFGLFLLPRLSILYKYNRAFSARLNGGTGYKTPTTLSYLNQETDLNKLGLGFHLNPEQSSGLNADINYQALYSNGIHLTINQSAFYTEINKPIYDSSSQYNVIALVNANNKLQTQGLQTYVRIRKEEFELYLGYVFTDVMKQYDTQHPNPIITPKHNFSSTLFFEPKEAWRFGIESSWIAGQVDQEYKAVKNYFLMAAMVQYKYKQLCFVLNGENLLDFRQNKAGRIYDGSINNPIFHKLWAPIDGRVINLSIQWKLRQK